MAGWKPHVGFQSIALDARYVVDELFLGGDRGGGKSAVMLADYAINVQEHPDPKTGEILPGPCRPWQGVIFRRHYNEFNTLIERSKEVFYGLFGDRDQGGRAKYLEGDKRWVFYDEKGKQYPDVSLELFPVERDSDIDKFIGLEKQFVGWDELPQWASPKPYQHMMASMRAGKQGIPIRCRSTGNPGGAGIGWIKKRFNIPDGDKDEARAASGKPILWKDGRSGKQLVRMFLLSLREENEALKRSDPLYEARVAAAVEGDTQLEKAWLDSDFSALFGQFFRLFSDKIHKVDPLEVLAPHNGIIPPYWKLDAWLDYGDGAAPTSFALVTTTPEDKSYVLAEYYDWSEYASDHASACEELYRSCPYTKGRKPSKVWADSQIFYTRVAANRGQMDKRVSDVFKREAGLNVVPSNKDRISGWRHLKNLIGWKQNDDGVFVREPTLYYFPECENFEREIKDAVHATTGNPEDLDKGCSDHALDGVRYWAMGARKPQRLNLEKLKQRLAEKNGATFTGMMKQAKDARRGTGYIPAPYISNVETSDIDQQLDEMVAG